LGKISDALEKVQTPPERRGHVEKVAANRDEMKPAVLDAYRPQPAIEQQPQKPIHKKKSVAPKPPAPDASKPAPPARKRRPPRFNEQAIDPNLIAFKAPDSYEAEQFRMLRTNVLFPKSGKPARNIMIASTAPSEGKSFVAANLAISIAQNIDKHVLLIDCDMRKPTIHKLFGLGPAKGLSDYLHQGEPLPSLMHRTFFERLTIIPGGPPPPNPAELLSSGRMTDLLREVSQRYSDRFIIIDTPPIQLTAEAQALAKFTDGVILVVRFGRSNKALAAEVVRKIGKDKLIGVVGNFTEGHSAYKGYAGKYYGYHRKAAK
jgi:exopolysaccharide/PEP-CTERM locus tyrosine autokinase